MVLKQDFKGNIYFIFDDLPIRLGPPEPGRPCPRQAGHDEAGQA